MMYLIGEFVCTSDLLVEHLQIPMIDELRTHVRRNSFITFVYWSFVCLYGYPINIETTVPTCHQV